MAPLRKRKFASSTASLWRLSLRNLADRFGLANDEKTSPLFRLHDHGDANQIQISRQRELTDNSGVVLIQFRLLSRRQLSRFIDISGETEIERAAAMLQSLPEMGGILSLNTITDFYLSAPLRFVSSRFDRFGSVPIRSEQRPSDLAADC